MRRRWLGFVLFCMSLCTGVFGQSAHLLLSSERAATSRTVLLKLWLDAPTISPAGLQWTFVYLPSQIREIAALGGPPVHEAHKSLTCVNQPRAFKCLSIGLNANVIEPGLIALVRVTLAPGVTNTEIPVYNAVSVLANGRELVVDSNVGFIHQDRPE